MSDFLRALLVFLAISNAAGAALAFDVDLQRGVRQRVAVSFAAWVLAMALAGFAVVMRERLLEALQIAAASFDLAAGAVMVVAALRPLWSGRTIDVPANARLRAWRLAVAPLAVPALAGPAALVAAIAYADRYETGATVAALAVAFAVTAVAAAGARPLNRVLGGAVLVSASRLIAAVLIVLAFALIVDGVQRV